MLKRLKIFVRGIVQGVGFRPFVYNLAKSLDLKGFVKNRSDGVEIDIEGRYTEKFLDRLKTNPPPLSKILAIEVVELSPKNYKDFLILKSQDSFKETFLPPDITICLDCLKELRDRNNRRFNYPLINCTNCGPRFTLIKDLPYDRKNSSMSKFLMCSSCKKEYEDPTNRRYHAQPISCFDCGPKVRLKKLENVDAIKETASILKSGKIVAIKGVGGYHLVCRADKDDVVKDLRDRKKRQKKPFAVMFKDIKDIERFCHLSNSEKRLILSKERPIVVVKKRDDSFKQVAPDIDRLGVFLPYTPLYYLLFDYIDFPLVVTSANISEEPIVKGEKELLKLKDVYDEILWYDRDIVNGCDDSVATVVFEKTIFYRLSRGYAPKSFFTKESLPQILAVGARQKNSISLGFKNSIILSPHIGDIKNIESFEYFKKMINTFKRVYNFEPKIVVCDKHPGYETTDFAKSLGLKTYFVQHHLAHVYAALAEMNLLDHELKSDKFISFSWDGTGYGDDGNIWGGEVFLEDERVYHFKYLSIAGAQKAIKDIRLIAWSLMRAYGFEVNNRLFNLAYDKKINCFKSSSVGRLFDAVAYIAGLCDYQYYEGYSGLLVEKAYNGSSDRYDFKIEGKNIIIDFESLIKDKKELIPTKFLNTLSEIILCISKEKNLPVILTGGVFQNKTLLEITTKKLQQNSIPYFFPTQVPINDGGISLGQLWFAVKKFNI